MTVRISGGAELSAFLKTFPRKLERSVMRGGLRAGAVVVRDKARELVKDDSGEIRSTIKYRTFANKDRYTAVVETRGSGAYKSVFLEYGTAAHYIQTKLRRSMKIGDDFVGRVISHPGGQAHPFMRPALDIAAADAVKAMADYINRRLQSTRGWDIPEIVVEDDQ